MNSKKISAFILTRGQGTSIDQDSRFANKEKKLLKTMKFDPVLSEKVSL